MRLNLELAMKILNDVDEGHRFFCENGSIFSNLKDLEIGFKNMSNEIFLHHTEGGKNDFADWIRGCLGDIRLADSLVGLDKNAALKKISSRIDYIEKYLEKRE